METGRLKAHRRSRGRVLGILLALAGLVALAIPGQALVNRASAEITCSEVTCNYIWFANADGNVTNYEIRIDPGTPAEVVLTGQHMFEERQGTGTVPLRLSPGDHHIEAWAYWDTNGHKKSLHKNGEADVTCAPPPGHEDCTILGTAGIDILDGGINLILADVICGFEDGDTLNGLTENDILRGMDGDDTLDGGPGNDKLVGGDGDDSLTDPEGNDKHKAGAGDDTVSDMFGNNRVYGGKGDDTVSTGDGNDVVRGGPRDDTLSAGLGENTVLGGRGIDFIEGDVDDDALFGGAGDDVIFDLGGNNWLRGGKGDDSLASGPGEDRMFGGPGDDVLASDGGSDMLTGGRGADLYLAGSEDDTIYSMHDDGVPDTINCGDGVDVAYVRIDDIVIDDPAAFNVCETVIVVS